MIRAAWWVVLPAVLVSLVSGCSAAGRDPDHLVVAIASSPNDLDPRIGSDESSQHVHQLVYSSLMRLDERLRVVPDLAVAIDTPDDRTYRLTIRDDVTFHDGRPLTAEDVAYTYRSFLDPSFVSPRAGAYRLVERVTALDATHVEFRLTEPFGSFPINLVMGIVPRGTPPSGGPAIGSGPYRVAAFRRDDRLELVRNDVYFGGPAANRGITLKVVPDDTMRGLELQKGTVDLVINDLAPDIVHQLAQEGRLQVVTAPGADYAYIGLNLRDPYLRDVRVRHALGFAIDRHDIVAYLRRGLAVPAVGILPPMSWAFEPDVFSFTYDPARAKQLLDDAGYPDPDGDGPAVRFRLTLKTSTAEFIRLQAAVVQQQLQQVGIGLDVRSSELTTVLQDVARGNFQLFTLQWVGVSDPDMLRRVFHSQQMPPYGFNRGFFENAEVDRAIDLATRSLDDAERGRLYGEVQRRVAREAPYISLWYKTNVVVAQPDVRGISLSPIGDFSFLRHVTRRPSSDTP